MNFGYLDVYWPDGRIKRYPLQKTSTAIGRSSGNDILLESTGISRYHVVLSHQEGQMLLVDKGAVNGTYVDGMRVPAEKSHPLQGGETIQIGDLQAVYFAPDDSDPTAVFDPEETQRLKIAKPTYRVELTAPTMSLAPGMRGRVTLVIENLSEEEDVFFVEVNGIPPEWVQVEPREITLAGKRSLQATMTFSPPAESITRPGEYEVMVRVRSQSQPAAPVDVPLKLEVLSFHSFEMVLAEDENGRQDGLVLDLHNAGNTPLALRLRAEDPARRLDCRFEPDSVKLLPGQHFRARCAVKKRRLLLWGRPYLRKLHLIAEASEQPHFQAGLSAPYRADPILPVWGPPVIAFAAVLLVLIGLGVALILGRARDPQIEAFDVQPESLLIGESVEVVWKVRDAADIALRIGDENIPFDEPAGTHQQVMATPGEQMLVLVAANGEIEVTRTLYVTVAEPLAIRSFTAEPSQLLIGLPQEVSLRWEVSGADMVRLEGAESLTGKPHTNPLPPTGKLTLNGRPSPNARVVLVIEGPDGEERRQAVDFDIRLPRCTVKAASSLRKGPSIFHEEVASLSEGGSVAVEARDLVGKWLRASIEGLSGWVSLDDLICEGFDPALLEVWESYPTAPPTRTPTASTTPSPSMTATRTPTSTPAATFTPRPLLSPVAETPEE